MAKLGMNDVPDVWRQSARASLATLDSLYPDAPLGPPLLICTCADCIDGDVLRRLETAPPRAIDLDDLSLYFSAASGIAHTADRAESQRQALILYLRLIDALTQTVLTPSDQARADWYVEAEHWVAALAKTGFIEDMADSARSILSAHFACLAEALVVGVSSYLSLILTYWGRLDPVAVEVWLDDLGRGAPRRHLSAWVAIGGRMAASRHVPKGACYDNFEEMFAWAKPEARAALKAALARPETGRLIERYAFAARDQDWFALLSRLLDWRAATIEVNRTARPAWYAQDDVVAPYAG